MNTPGVGGIPYTFNPARISGLQENTQYYEEKNFLVSGITTDNLGAALGNCTVNLFNTVTNVLSQTTTSDANGNYSFILDKTQTWYCVAYKAGSPDVSGVTVNTLVGV